MAISASVWKVNKILLQVIPIQTSRAEKGSSVLMIETSSRLDIPRNMGVQRLPFRGDPIYNGTFHSFHIISTSPIYAFLNLRLRLEVGDAKLIKDETYKVCNVNDLIL